MLSNPPWATACVSCGAELARGDWRPPSWLVMARGGEAPIFAMRRRRRRRQWYGVGFIVLIVAGIAYGRYAQKLLSEPAPGEPPGVGATSARRVGPGAGQAEDGGGYVPFETAEPREVPWYLAWMEDLGPEEAVVALTPESMEPGESVPGGESEPSGTAIARAAVTGAASAVRVGAAVGIGSAVRIVSGGGGAATGPGRPGFVPVGANERLCQKDGAVMVRVPAGTFVMGADDGDDAERPAHKVAIRQFWLDKHEVTNRQYKAFVEATGNPVPYAAESWAEGYRWDRTKRTYPEGTADDPVVLVSWSDAAAYARWAGKRLPTEAEWEYAARGADARTYPWGNGWESGRCNAVQGDSHQRLAPANAYPGGASWCGALNMSGNAWEWVADWFGATYYSESPSADPKGPQTGRYRVLRGGSFACTPLLCRASTRLFRPPHGRSEAAGFRCAADL